MSEPEQKKFERIEIIIRFNANKKYFIGSGKELLDSIKAVIEEEFEQLDKNLECEVRFLEDK